MKWSDYETEQILGNLLRIGVLAAGFVVFTGGVVYLMHYGADIPSYHLFRGEPAELRSISGILAEAMTGRSRALIQAGLLLLIATPIARVAFSIFAFLKERDYLYVAITIVVFAVLVASLFQ